MSTRNTAADSAHEEAREAAERGDVEEETATTAWSLEQTKETLEAFQDKDLTTEEEALVDLVAWCVAQAEKYTLEAEDLLEDLQEAYTRAREAEGNSP